MFYLEKTIKALLSIPTLLCFIAIAGVYLTYKKRKQGKPLLISALVLFWLLSTPTGAYVLIKPLIRGLHTLDVKTVAAGTNVMVLGGGCSQSDYPVAEQLSNPSLRRVLEGYRIWSRLPGSKIIFSGNDWMHDCNIAELGSSLVQQWSKDTVGIFRLGKALNTREEAKQYIKQFGNANPVVLVTSAMHMPRATKQFEKLGIKVIQAPTDFPIKHNKIGLLDFLPNLDLFGLSCNAWVEWMALFKLKMEN